MIERVIAPLRNFADPEMLTKYVRRMVQPARRLALTAAATITLDDFYVTGDATGAAFTITLPLALPAVGHVFAIKRLNAGANNVTIDGAGAEAIDAAATLVLNAQYQSRLIFSDGTSWSVIGGYL